jgi:hypothetical protein
MLTRKMLEVDFSRQVADCRRELLDKLKVSLLRISKNRINNVLADLFNNLPAQ